MPRPGKGETEKEFIPRCIKKLHDEGKYKDNKQIVAICYSMWRKKDEFELVDRIDILLDDNSGATTTSDIPNEPFKKDKKKTKLQKRVHKEEE